MYRLGKGKRNDNEQNCSSDTTDRYMTFNPCQNNFDITDVIVTDVNVTSVFVKSPSVTTLATTDPMKSSKSLVMINPTHHYDTYRYICDIGGLCFSHVAHMYVTLVHTNC